MGIILLSVGLIGLCAVLHILRPVAKVLNFFALMQAPMTHVMVVGTSKDGKARSTVTLSYPGDPGIVFTAALCLECAVALADTKLMSSLSTEAAARGGGVSTPTIVFGDALLPRLQAAGVTVTQVTSSPE